MLKSYVTALLFTLMTAAPAAAQCKNAKVTVSCYPYGGTTGGYMCNEAQAECAAGQRTELFQKLRFDCLRKDENGKPAPTCLYDVTCCSRS
ncbi:hypothetical protein CH063_01644 [Colletotrichum higginsianum]|uniref:Uncharacterized protein n=1 Tax=Colletotrichum higginsianum (strain IMI 349063) TaxID=759273 RepID=H1VAA9_COLHI|nr:hypothetical protein CH063_01644 [Colletotrichum higginsianum]